MPTLFTVANRLPVTISDEGVKRSSGGLVAALEGLPRGRYDLRWIGWPGAEVADPGRQDDVRRQLGEQATSPVFLTADEAAGHYEGFSNASLWPLLHNMTTRFRYDPAWWDVYRAVNQRFADAVLAEATEGDLVWVHDYQLMLVPKLLKDARPELRVGFFLHTPFPSYETFRCHPQREAIIAGVVGADLIGFHTFGYLRHFRSAVLRLLGIESEITKIRHDGRTSTLGVYPIGINGAKFDKALDAPAFDEKKQQFADVHRGKRLVLSVERLDYTKGLLERLDAIDEFLSTYDGREQMRFVFVSVPSRENVAEYRELIEAVEHKVGRINGRHTTLHNTPIHFIHGSVQFDELVALYALAEVCLVTPLIDGMNLVAKEYAACQREPKADPGVLVLSEFAGAAEELFSAIVVNPYDTRQLSLALRQALDMPADERRERMAPMRQRVMTWDAGAWARQFVDDLAKPAARPATGSGAADPAEARERLSAAVAGGQRVALMLDYDGTLREFEREPHLATPTPAVRSLIDRLAAVPNVDVTIISGRSAGDLEQFWGEAGVSLIAEHGAAVRRRRASEWEQLDRNVSYAWKDELRTVLRLFADATPGSFVEDKRTSLVWHYRNADPEFGDYKARQLVTELATLTSNAPLEVRHGRKIVEVTATQVNKGAAVLRLMDEATYDLTLCAGDDTTDESMFRLDVAGLVTVKVGDGDTQARYRVATPAEFRRFLGSLVGSTGTREHGRDAGDKSKHDADATVTGREARTSQAPFGL